MPLEDVEVQDWSSWSFLESLLKAVSAECFYFPVAGVSCVQVLRHIQRGAQVNSRISQYLKFPQK